MKNSGQRPQEKWEECVGYLSEAINTFEKEPPLLTVHSSSAQDSPSALLASRPRLTPGMVGSPIRSSRMGSVSPSEPRKL